MKIAAYNLENMFRRPLAFHDPGTKKSHPEIVQAYSRLTELLEQASYADTEKEILELVKKLGIERQDEGTFVWLRKIRGSLLRRPRSGGKVELAARGRTDWIGWVELKKGELNSRATQNTAAVIADVDPDVLAVVEAEDRMALERFNEYVLEKVTKEAEKQAKKAGEEPTPAWRFAHAMLVDGNDERGIDVGVMAKGGFEIDSIRSHVDDREIEDDPDSERVFSRDCAEYEISTRDGKPLLLMVNHFKSQMGGGGSERRELQAGRVAEIYRDRRKEGWDRVVIAGDLNDVPDSEPLAPLLAKTDLKDAGTHKKFVWGERQGTYDTGNKQFDYLLLSPALFKKVTAGGVNRKGIWRGERTRNKWKILDTLTKPEEGASDHAAIWVELDV